MNVLMLSSSRFAELPYLAYASDWMNSHLGDVKDVLFIPYAGVTTSWDAYTQMVQSAIPQLKVTGLHQTEDPVLAIRSAQAILVGGGNTFRLLHELYHLNLISLIQEKVNHGMPYIGWSAGANICGQSIRTTNDMPIIEPPSFQALAIISAQINPHYTDIKPKDFHGETRDQRISEFCVLHPSTPVLAIKEGSALSLINNRLTLLGDLNGFVFEGDKKQSISPGQDLSEYI